MNRNIMIILSVFLLSLPLWLGLNLLQENLEDFLVVKELEKEPIVFSSNLFKAQIIEIPQERNCVFDKIKAESLISVKNNEIIFQKEANKKLPIASLTKLMTAVIAKEFYPETQKIQVSKKAIDQLESIGYLREGELLDVNELLQIALIESSNDAAFALSEMMGDGFVDLMNLKAQDLRMNDTHFYNCMGLDPDDLKRNANEINLSTVKDLAKLISYIYSNHTEIMEILSKREEPLYLTNGVLHHSLKTTNELNDPLILGGKTGFTERAGGCLLIVLKDGTINILLNSPSRFSDMQTLIDCSYDK